MITFAIMNYSSTPAAAATICIYSCNVNVSNYVSEITRVYSNKPFDML